MESDPSRDALVAELRMLGRVRPDPATSGPDDLAVAVLSRLEGIPAQADRRWGGKARRRALVVLVVVLLGVLGVPPVRAAVVDWFSFDGVIVHIGRNRDQPPRPAPPPPTVRGGPSLDRARALVGFRPLVPAVLGPPDGVEVSPDRRMLSTTWTGADGPLRLDQFDGSLDYAFAKTAPSVEWTTVGDAVAFWFAEPHEVVVLDAAGRPRTETARLAGHTLIWEAGGTVLRLEGDLTRERALEIAASAQPS